MVMFAQKCRKGAFFSMDALVAVSILLLAYSAIIGIRSEAGYETSDYQQMHYLAEDAMQVFSNTKFDAINESLRNEILLGTPEITAEDLDKDVIEIIGLLWSLNKTGYAENITRDVLDSILFGKNYSLKIYDYKSDSPTSIYPSAGIPLNKKSGTAVFRLISGYKENSNRTGFVSRAFVSGAVKKTQSYAYFGGFEGNGNITKLLVLPSAIEAINEIYMEMDVPSNFTLYINGVPSGIYNITNRIPLRANNWTVPSAYNANLVPGSNNLTIGFTDINSAYVGGGFIRVKYNTSVMDTADLKMNPDKNITGRYSFPGIDGIINIYSSFYVPGALKSLGAQIHYASNYTVYLILGNTTIYENSANTTENIYLNSSYLSSILNYSNFFQTMPIRFGTKNISGLTKNSDIVLITDFSGSMKKAIDDDTKIASNNIDCSNLTRYPDTRKYQLAKCLDYSFVNTVLNNTGNSLWPVFIQSDNIESYGGNPQDAAAINNSISSYNQGDGYTCLACALNRAYNILNSTAGNGKRKFVILMTDGVPTHCASGSCTSNSSVYGTQWCQGYCDTQGGGGSCNYQGCADNACSNPINNTLYAANRSFIDLDITINTIGFGLVDNCSQASILLRDVANMTNGTYYHSSNISELERIYKDIANSIITYSTQAAAISGEISPAKLYSDSFIEYNYTPATDIAYGNISLIRESGTFGNTSGNYSVEQPKNGSYDVPGGVAIIDAKATSYSSDYWTNIMKVKNADTSTWTTAFNLSVFGSNYLSLGDPYIVNIPVSLITPGGKNYVQIDTSTNSTDQKGGSPDNRVIYTIKVKGSVGYGDTFNTTQEATNDAKKRLNDTLSPLGIDINDIETGTQDVGKIPWMWGPAIMVLEVWK